MVETLSHKFIAALELPRDELYGEALAREGNPQKAEGRMREVARELFGKFVVNSSMDVAGEFRVALGAGAGEKVGEKAIQNMSSTDPKVVEKVSESAPKDIQKVGVEYFMPADVWARLAASIQVEASKSTVTKAISADSVLLSPDPLLAPKKAAGGEPVEGLDLPGPSRFLLASGVVIVIGIILTVYIATRPVMPRPGGGVTPPPTTTTMTKFTTTGTTSTTGVATTMPAILPTTTTPSTQGAR